MRKAIEIDGFALCYGSEEIKNDEELVLLATQKRFYYFKFASEKLKQNWNFIF